MKAVWTITFKLSYLGTVFTLSKYIITHKYSNNIYILYYCLNIDSPYYKFVKNEHFAMVFGFFWRINDTIDS